MKNRQELIQEMYKLYNGYDEAVKQFVDFANRCNDIKVLNAIVEAHRYNGNIRRVVKRKFKNNT